MSSAEGKDKGFFLSLDTLLNIRHSSRTQEYDLNLSTPARALPHRREREYWGNLYFQHSPLATRHFLLFPLTLPFHCLAMIFLMVISSSWITWPLTSNVTL